MEGMEGAASTAAGEQPGTGDGAAAANGNGGPGPFSAVLDAVPDGREAVEAALKEVEGKVTQRFQESADFRKQWEPYSEAGLGELPADQLTQIVAFHQILGDPQQLQQVLQAEPEVAAQVEQWWAGIGEQAGWFENDGEGEGVGDGDEPSPEVLELRQQVAEMRQMLEPVVEGQRSQEAEQRLTAVKGEVDQAIEGLKAEHPDLFGDDAEEVKQAICTFARSYEGSAEEVIGKGFADYQRLISRGERGLLDSKVGQPETPEHGGQPGTEPEVPASFREAKTIAARRFAQARADAAT